ncbi:uncharacterized protein DUF2536 [Salsuginibacillus halophilus]|uniref:Uncharacterized protein DUF2536 n=1 Tax=Salsuginibacillus halophilus TaxID=517424 RepID=A0A2P8HFT9_9BACI|nr:DUF2536 family protein [Salsuginibacillus halophilus]PSL45077.1 uncharacterized protein DUF2536 [Salsuginibacillus halophilus]
MELKLQQIEDKIEFFEARTFQDLEANIQARIEVNEQILLHIHRVQHQVYVDPSSGQPVYTANVHFKRRA